MEGILKKSLIFLAAIILAAALIPGFFAGKSFKSPKAIELPNEAVSKKILDNGLVILVKAGPPKNLAAINVKVRAGSSLEGEYLGSGVSHLVEHMLFKGTSTMGPGEIEKQVKSWGGFINGSTSQDLTEYSIIVPAEFSPQALSLLKDMLLNASFDETQFIKEKDVVLKELRLDNDEPQNLIIRLLNETAYLRHTYKYPPIGYEDKFRALTREDAVKYYNRMYAPNRMALAIVGGIDKDAVLAKAEAEFRNFARSPDYTITGLSPVEPAQIESRDEIKRIDTNLAYLAIGYHSTSLLNEDIFAMDVLSMVLGRGDNSRFNTELFKKRGLVHSISCWNFTPRDPGLFVVTAILDPDKIPAAQEMIRREITKVKSGAVTADELDAAKRMVLADFIFSLQTVDAQASNMTSEYLITGSYDFSRRYVKGVQAVSAEDLKRVADKYLKDEAATTVKIVPGDSGLPENQISVSAIEAPVKRLVLPNGLKLIIRQNTNTPTIAITVLAGGGLSAETKTDNGISNLVARMLLKGTSTRREGQIAGAIEKLGGSIEPFSGFDGFGLNLELLKPDLDTVIPVIQDILAKSVFPADELEKERKLVIAMIREEGDDIFRTGLNAFRQELFAGSPYGLRYLGEENTVRGLSRGALIDYYKKYIAPDNMIISVSGDIAPEDAEKKLTKAFSGMGTRERLTPYLTPHTPNLTPNLNSSGSISVRNMTMPKEQSLVVLGFMTPGVKDPDRYTFDVLGSVLSGYSGRLFGLRNTRSLAYTLGCVHKAMIGGGFFALYIATVKERLAEAEKDLLKEAGDIRTSGITEEELIAAKRELICDHAIKMQTNNYFSETSAVDELYGLGCEDIFKYGEGIGKVTAEDVKRAAGKYLDPGRYSEIVISGQDALNNQ